jgi:hypothetical protein
MAQMPSVSFSAPMLGKTYFRLIKLPPAAKPRA